MVFYQNDLLLKAIPASQSPKAQMRTFHLNVLAFQLQTFYIVLIGFLYQNES